MRIIKNNEETSQINKNKENNQSRLLKNDFQSLSLWVIGGGKEIKSHHVGEEQIYLLMNIYQDLFATAVNFFYVMEIIVWPCGAIVRF